MRSLTTIGILFAFTCTLAVGASLPATSMHGTYVEARTADVFTGPCFANGEAGLIGNLAVFGWKVEKGAWKGVKLDGLGVIGVIKASDTLGYVSGHPYPVKSVLIVDERADAEQRLALKSFAQRMGGDLLQDIVRIDYRAIDLQIEDGNIHSAKATLIAGDLAKIQTRALSNKDHVCGNEEVWYLPLTKLEHAMPAYTLAHSFKGEGLGTKWSTPGQRSAFVGSFQYND